MKKAVIFDLDGTLLYTLDTIAYHLNTQLNAYNACIETEKVCEFVGNGAKKLIERTVDYCGLKKNVFDGLYSAYTRAYDENPAYLTRVYDGVGETLADLKSRGVKLAVLSNKPHFATVAAIEGFLGKDTFDIICGQRAGVPTKPDPAAVFMMLDEMGVCADDSLFVGDSDVDVLTGKNSGIFTLGAAWGFRGETALRECGADAVINSPKEIKNFI